MGAAPRARRAILALFAAATLLVPLGCGGDEDSTPAEPDQEALEQARQEGAQQARQNARIKALKKKLRESDEEPTGAAVTTTPSAIAPPSAASTYVPTYVEYIPSDPNYAYIAEIPSGGGWSAPSESYPTGGELLRTSLRGPDGTLLIIDYTPNEVPQLGGEYDVASTNLPTNFGTATEYIFSESEGLPDCNGRPCADFLVNDGAGGGWGVLGGGPSLPVAESIAARVAQSISYVD